MIELGVRVGGAALPSVPWNGAGLNNNADVNGHFYTFLTSNPFSVLRLEKPSIVARLMGSQEDRIRWNKGLDKELFVVLF